ncbi:MAG: gamma-glutamyl-gamma-aminobutyrate hydrolase family protein [Patescibacteria group bacterium]|jgi:GMP synthase (glutamine-hydrolysing)
MVCIVDCGSEYIGKLTELVCGFGYTCTTIPDTDIANADMSGFSHVIISGAPTMLTEMDTKEYVSRFSFIKTAHIPILGICNGHQVMGLLFGATISRGDMIHRMEPISIIQNDLLFAGISDRTAFQEEHREFITLPEGFTLLASSPSCSNEAMRHTSKPLYGVQFHPEASGQPGNTVIRNFLTTTE